MTVPQYAPQRPPLSIQRDRLPITTVIARGVSPVAIRSLSVPLRGRAVIRTARGCGLPRRFAPRNDAVIFGWSFFLFPDAGRHRRAGPCPAPTGVSLRNRVGATLAVARNAGDGVPYGFPFDPRRRNAAGFPMSSGIGGTAQGPFPCDSCVIIFTALFEGGGRSVRSPLRIKKRAALGWRRVGGYPTLFS